MKDADLPERDLAATLVPSTRTITVPVGTMPSADTVTVTFGVS